jgi:5-methylcytosine-specific restriction endonuclease McrA
MSLTPTKAFKLAAFKRRRQRECEYCGKKLTFEQATVDHHIPKAKGGYNRRGNMRIACNDCNQRKGSMDPGTFMALLAQEAAR